MVNGKWVDATKQTRRRCEVCCCETSDYDQVLILRTLSYDIYEFTGGLLVSLTTTCQRYASTLPPLIGDHRGAKTPSSSEPRYDIRFC